MAALFVSTPPWLLGKFRADNLQIDDAVSHRAPGTFLSSKLLEVLEPREHPPIQSFFRSSSTRRMSSVPSDSRVSERSGKGEISVSAVNPPSGCHFRTRCQKFATLDDARRRACIEDDPALEAVSGDHAAACHYAERLRVV